MNDYKACYLTLQTRPFVSCPRHNCTFKQAKSSGNFGYSARKKIPQQPHWIEIVYLHATKNK